ncbi:pseudaminic acid synthase [freshwater metagenome]|uniref:Pseudaminic acid synthase n=1 Tax=freshwater metagenome TaxID=449393 RepID=A0A094QCU8_9ZZZZ
MIAHLLAAAKGNRRPYIIAEMSGNHNGSLDRALEIVDAAAKNGADAIKLQTYTAATMTLDVDLPEFKILDESSLWAGRALYDLYEEAHTPWDWHEPLFARARELGLLAFSTPFDSSAVDFLESLDVEVYKIASFENTDLPLIRKAASTGKPLIISTGLATVGEISDAVSTARNAGCNDLILLKTTSSYPASPHNTNLRTIPHMRELFGCEVGLSDHTLGIGVAIGSVSLGAGVIEKHLTLSRDDGGVDSAFSLVPSELKSLVEESERAWAGQGNPKYGPSDDELKSFIFRRSLYITEDLVAGSILSEHNVRAVRPGYGLPTKFLETILGKRVTRQVTRGTPLTWEIIG